VPVRQPRDRGRQRPAGEQEKVVTFGTLLANCVIFHTVVDMTTVIRELIAAYHAYLGVELAAAALLSGDTAGD